MALDVGNVTEKGQVTIPEYLREKYKIGDKVLFGDTGEGVLVRRMPKLSELKGIVKDSKVALDKIRQEERELEAAREQTLMAVIERVRKQQQHRQEMKQIGK